MIYYTPKYVAFGWRGIWHTVSKSDTTHDNCSISHLLEPLTRVCTEFDNGLLADSAEQTRFYNGSSSLYKHISYLDDSVHFFFSPS